MKSYKGISRAVVVAVTVVAVAFGGGVAFAAHQFDDVPDSSVFHDEIDFVASRAVTLGCDTDRYCPADSVPRDQMAAFLERTARALSPVVFTETEAGYAEGDNACVIGPFTADFEMIATFNGGAYGQGPGIVNGRVQYRTDGGAWSDVQGAWNVGSHSPDASSYANTPLVGAQPLTPGVAYEFSYEAASTRGDTGCQLTAIVHHQMPDSVGGGLEALAAADAGGNQE